MDEGHVGLGADIPGRVVHPGVVGPLVEHPAGLFVHVLEHCVLSDEDKAEGGDQVVDAVVDLRVDVIGTARHDTTKIFRPVSRAKEMYSSPFFCTSRRKSS